MAEIESWGFQRPTARTALNAGDIFLGQVQGKHALGIALAASSNGYSPFLVLHDGTEGARAPYVMPIDYLSRHVRIITEPLHIIPAKAGLAEAADREPGAIVIDEHGHRFLEIEGRLMLNMTTWTSVDPEGERLAYPAWRLVVTRGEQEMVIYTSPAGRAAA